MEEETTKLGRVVPYLLYVSAMLLIGYSFVIINGILIVETIRGGHFQDWKDLARRYDEGLRNIQAAEASVSGLVGGLLLCLILGFSVQMIASGVSTLIVMLAGVMANIKRVKARIPAANSFFSVNVFQREQAELRMWLLRNPSAKLHWEWELFNSVFYWGLTVNIIGASILIWHLLGSVQVPMLLISTIFCCYSFARSLVFGQFQRYCVDRMRIESDSGDRQPQNVEPS